MNTTHFVRNCTDCQDDECTREEHKPSNLPTTCSGCFGTRTQNQPTVFAGDCLGNVHAACSTHERYLAGWIADVDHEVRCDSIASARFEDAAYGEDY